MKMKKFISKNNQEVKKYREKEENLEDFKQE